MDNGHPMVELYQMNLKLTRKGGKSLDVVLSRSCTVRAVQSDPGCPLVVFIVRSVFVPACRVASRATMERSLPRW